MISKVITYHSLVELLLAKVIDFQVRTYRVDLILFCLLALPVGDSVVNFYFMIIDDDVGVPDQISPFELFSEFFVFFPGCQKENDQSDNADKQGGADKAKDFCGFHGGAIG